MPLVVDGVEIPIEAAINQASFNQVKEEIDALEKNVNGLIAKNKARRTASEEAYKAEQKAAQLAKKAQDEYRASLNRTREDAEKLQQIGTQLLMAGGAILLPMIASAKKFADSARESDSVAQRWKASFDSLSDSSNRAGRVIADQLNPVLERTSQIVGDLVGYIEKNPQIAGMALGVGATLLSAGTLVSVVASIEKTVATLQLLAGAGVVAEGAAAGGAVAGASAIAPVVAAVLASTVVVLAIHGVMQQFGVDAAIKERSAQAGANGQRPGYGTSLFAPPPLPTGLNDTQYKYLTALEREAIIKRQLSADARENDLAAALQAKAGIQAQIYAAEQSAAQKQIETLKKYAAQRAEVEANLAADNQRAYENYQNDRAQAERAASIDIERIKKDSQRKIQQLEADHSQRVYDLVAARDALGLVKENKRFSDEKKAEQDAAGEEIRRRRQDLKIRLEDMAKTYNLEMKQRRDAANARLKMITDQQNAELVLLAAQQKAIYDALIMAFNAAIVKIKTLNGDYQTPVTGAKASGGYSYMPGVYRKGEQGREFTADANTTRALERKVGGSLNQDNILGGGGSMTVNINLGGGSLTSSRPMINQAKAEIVREFRNALESF